MRLSGGTSRFFQRSVFVPLVVATVLASTLVISASEPLAAHAQDDCALFAPADVAENDWFGSSVGIDGDTAVITSWLAEEAGGPLNAGAAYVYDRQPDGSWVEGQKLLPSNPGAAFNFGFSADIEGDIIAIGAWHETVGTAPSAGAVYVFERPTPTGVWTETARLVASDADAADDLGYNLEVDAATSSIIVGAQQDDEGGSDAGAAYVFRKVDGSWTEEAKLLDPNANINDRAGNDVAIFGDWAVVGHHLDDVGVNGIQSNVGGALVYKRTGSTWGLPIELDVSDPEPVKNRAGYGVDVDGDLLVMTSYHDEDIRTPQAWVFRLINGVWVEEQHIYPYPSVNSGDHPFAAPDNDDGTHFGRHVEVDNGVIAIGSSYDAFLDFERGATHYFTQDTNGLWAETARIDPEGNAKYFHAGIAVGLSDTHAIVGAEKGNQNDDGIHEPFQTSPTEIFNSGLACIGELSGILDGSHSPNPFYGIYASVTDATVAEGPDGVTTQVAVDVNLSQNAPTPVTIDVSTADGSATTADSDYTGVTNQLVTIPAGSSTASVLIDVIGDYRSEPDETFSVVLSNPTTGVLIEDGVAEITITDEDLLAVSVGDASVVEGDSGNTPVLVDLSLPFPTPAAVTVSVATSDGTATTAGNDYVAYADTVTFNPGDQTKQVSIDVVGDDLIEPDETFTLQVTNTSAGLAVADGTGEITITGDDANPVSIGDASVTEGPAGADATVSVDVTLSEAAAAPIDVTVSSTDGTATLANGDYQAKTETVSFAIGETQKSVSFTVIGDNVAEPDEVFNAVLSNPTGGATIGDGSGDITILNDDSITVSIEDASTLEGADGVTTAVSVEVTLSAPAPEPLSVIVDTVDGTATTLDNDYTAITTQTVNFAVGETTQTVAVEVIGDGVQEPNEAFTVVASAPSAGLTIGDGTGTVDIFDDDSIAVVVGDATITEGDSPTTDTVTVAVTLTQPAVGAVDVTVATADGSASAGSDYVSDSQLVSFADGESSKTVTFTVNGDDTPESDETFLVQASNPTGAIIADGTGQVTIVDDDDIAVSISDASTLEGDTGSAPVLLDITLSQAAVGPLTVEVSTADGSATTADSDYVGISQQLVTFAIGESSKQLSVIVNGDEQLEDDEAFTVNLANPSNGLSIDDGTADVTITNDESISVSVEDLSVLEGAAATTATASVQVSLSDPATSVMTVLIDTTDGTATAGSDYVAPGQQTVTFQTNEQFKTVDITINGDDVPELDERFSVIASGPTGGLTLGDDTGVVTITNDDLAGPVTVTIGDQTVTEGDTGSATAANVTVSLSSPAVVPIDLEVSTVAGTATSGTDYEVITAQAVSFAVGEQTKIVTVNVTGDDENEPTETLTLVGGNLLGSGASFADDTGQITITDDDEVTVSIDDVAIVEGNAGVKNLFVNISLNRPSFQTVQVSYASADGTAVAYDELTAPDGDYIPSANFVGFLPGDTVKTRVFKIVGDTNVEDDEVFTVELSNPINASLGQGSADVTILDDDTPFPSLTIGDVTVNEGDSPTTVVATVPLTLTEPATEDVSFTLATVDGTATLAGGDFVEFNSTVTILEGEQSTSVDIIVNGDELAELNETFTVVASNPVGEIDFLDDTGEITIIDDDSAITASVVDVSVVETTDVTVANNVTTTGTIDLDVTIALSFPAPGPLSIDLSTVDGTANSTTANPDFVALTDQTISFAENETSQTVTIQVYADNIAESDEAFTVVASNATGGLLIADDTGEVTITDDDIVEISVNGIAVSEGNAGSKNAIVTFSLSNPSSVAVKVDYATADGTATLADNDYVERLGSVQFAPFALTRTRGFSVLGDTNLESDEVFAVNLSNPTNAIIGTGTTDVTILDDDNPSNPLSVSDVTVTETDSGTVTADVTLSLAEVATEAFTVDVETLNGTAFSGSDYTPITPPQIVSFAIGDQSKVVSIDVVGDTAPEADETFALVASNSTAAAVDFADNIGQITILNDDLIDVSVSDGLVTEGAATTTVDATVDVSLSQPAIGTMTVDVATLDGSATTGDSDYVATTQTVTFADGEQTKPVTIVVNGDDRFEADESFSVVASSPSAGLNILDGTGTVGITNDDTAATLSVVIGGATVTEPDTGSTIDALVDVTLSAPATSVVSLLVTSADGTATVGDSDYQAFSQTVTFQPSDQTVQLAVTVNGDDIAELDEVFTLVGTDPSAGLAILDGIGEITILNNDAAPGVDLSVMDTTIAEGNSGTATASVTLSLAQSPVFPVSVDVSTVDGTATVADNDYIAIAAQTVTFDAGEQTKVVDITVNGDTKNELDETFTLVASNPVGAVSLVKDTGVITITSDDAIMISVGDVILTEINAGFRWAQVPFTLTAPASAAGTVTVQYTSQDGTATLADNDYEFRTGELRFGNGVSTLTRGFKVFGDTQAEANEVFTVELSDPVNALIADGIGEVTILDDDTSIIGLTVGDVTVTEGDVGTSVATVDLTLDSPAVSPLTVDVATVDGSATVAGSDYVAVPTQPITFAANEQSKTVDITINGDTAIEDDETFTLVATNPSQGLSLTDDTGLVTILHDDQPRLSIADVSVTEQDAGTVNAAVTVSLDRAPVSELTVVVSTMDGSATIADSDYNAIGETLTFTTGEQAKIVNVTVNGDTDFETDEQFSLVASNPSAGLVLEDGTGVITIQNDDSTGSLSLILSDASVLEGADTSTTTATVDVTLSAPAPVEVTVDVATVDGTAQVADSDYMALPLQTITFIPGQQTQALEITVNGDDTDEADEGFTVVASNPSPGLNILDGIGDVTIVNDDIPPGLQVSVGDASITEGENGTSIVSVPVSLNQPTPVPVTVEVNTVDDTATTADGDYVAVTAQTVNFAANEQNATVEIIINGDTNQELDESFNLVASNPSAGLALGDDTGVITIISDDGVTISVGDVTLTESNAGSKLAHVAFTLSAAPGANTFIVQYATQDGTATVADGDYLARSGELRFANGTTVLTRGFRIYGDVIPEADELFSVVLSDPVNGSIADGIGQITILDNDNTGAGLSLADVAVEEGNAGSTVATVQLSLQSPALNTLSVDVATVDGTATVANGDYTPISTQAVTFNPGEQTKNVDVTITGDTSIENTEALTLVASNPSGGLILIDDTAAITIINDDFPAGTVALTVGDITVTEGEAGTVNASVSLTLDTAPTIPVSVTVDTADGSATSADSDYVPVVGQTVNFAVDQQSQTVDIVVNGDTTPEVDETFTLVATNPTVGMVLADGTGEITIETDDAITVSAGDVTLTEIDAGSRWAHMTFTLSAAPGSQTFVVQYATQDGTATLADGDYEQRTGELRFASSRTTLSRGFKVFGDTTPELDEIFTVELSNPVNGIIADGTGEVLILDDDASNIALTVGDATIVETDTGSTSVLVDLTLASAATIPMTVDVATADGTATTADADYSAVSQQVGFAVGEQTKQVSIEIIGDTDIELDETFSLVASNPSTGLLLADDTGEITITNDDAPPTIDVTISDASTAEGDTGETVPAVVTVTLSQNAVIPVSIDLSTVDGSATEADGDFTGITNQTVTFAAGESSKPVTVDIIGDDTFELDETFQLVISNESASLNIVDATADITITNDDAQPALSVLIGDATVVEGDAGVTNAVVDVSLTSPAIATVTVDVTTNDGSANVADNDYAPVLETVSFAAGESLKQVLIPINGDITLEPDEIFTLDASNPSAGLSILDGSGVVTIQNDEVLTVDVGDQQIIEGAAQTTSQASVQLTLSEPAVAEVTVLVDTVDGTALVADGDYVAVSGQLVTFPIGSSSQTVQVTVNGDDTIEGDENFSVVASAPSAGLTLGDAAGTVTIQSDDQPLISIDDVTLTELNAGYKWAQVRFSLSQPSTQTVQLQFTTVDATATAASGDYITRTETVAFAPGTTQKFRGIQILGDTLVEGDEFLTVELVDAPINAAVGDGVGRIDILDNDD